MDTTVSPLLDGDAEAAAYLRSSPRHLRELRSRRAIPFTKVGRLVRYRVADLDAWLAAQTIHPETDESAEDHAVLDRVAVLEMAVVQLIGESTVVGGDQ